MEGILFFLKTSEHSENYGEYGVLRRGLDVYFSNDWTHNKANTAQCSASISTIDANDALCAVLKEFEQMGASFWDLVARLIVCSSVCFSRRAHRATATPPRTQLITQLHRAAMRQLRAPRNICSTVDHGRASTEREGSLYGS